MCENCEKIKETAWAEIRDLLNFNRKVKGPLSENFAARVDAMRNSPDAPPENVLSSLVESLRAEMIADRCVLIARSCVDTDFHMMPGHMIMGAWAGEMMKEEIAARIAAGGGLMGLLFGMKLPTDDED